MPLIGTVQKGKKGGGFIPTTKTGVQQGSDEGIGALAIVPAGFVRIISADLGGVFVDALLNTDGIHQVGGGPRHDISARAGRTGVAEYQQHDPMEIAVSIILDGYEDDDYLGVQSAWDTLHSFTGRVAGQHRVPIVRLRGGSVPKRYEGRKWLANGPLEEDDSPTAIYRQVAEGTAPLRLAFTMSFVEKTPDPLLRESISESKRTGKGKGFNNKKTVAQAGEDAFGDISKRLYGTRNRAVDLAAANALPLGFKIKKGMKIRLPQ